MVGHEVDLRLEHAALLLHPRHVAPYADHVPKERRDAPVRRGGHQAHGARRGRQCELCALELVDHALDAEEEVDVRPLADVPLVVDAVELRPDPVRPEHDGVRIDERACLGLGLGLGLGVGLGLGLGLVMCSSMSAPCSRLRSEPLAPTTAHVSQWSQPPCHVWFRLLTSGSWSRNGSNLRVAKGLSFVKLSCERRSCRLHSTGTAGLAAAASSSGCLHTSERPAARFLLAAAVLLQRGRGRASRRSGCFSSRASVREAVRLKRLILVRFECRNGQPSPTARCANSIAMHVVAEQSILASLLSSERGREEARRVVRAQGLASCTFVQAC